MPLLKKNELSFRRPAHDVLFFAEEGVDDRDGPLSDAMGFLVDMAQVFEALDYGFRDQPPLKMDAIDDIVGNIINPMGSTHHMKLIGAVTDFDLAH